MAYKDLLSSGTIGSMSVRNRIVLSAMGSDYADPDGTCNERLLNYYQTHARGGTGLIVLETSAVDWPNGATSAHMPGFSDDRFIAGLEAVTAGVHREGAKIAVQLNHGGKVARYDIESGRPMLVPSVPDQPSGDLLAAITGEELAHFAGSQGPDGQGPQYKVVDQRDIKILLESFAAAASRAKQAGFDAIEIHAGHGYLLASFLSPFFNRRRDDYGGSATNRARLLCEVMAAVRQAVGAGFPLMVRLDAYEFGVEGGITLKEALVHAQLVEAAGADAIDVSAYGSGLSSLDFTTAPLVHKPNGLLDFAVAIKKAVSVPVIAVGRISPEKANAAIGQGLIDFVAMGRKLLADPELANKLQSDPKSIRPCIYCYLCVSKIFLDQPMACAVNPALGREADLDLHYLQSTKQGFKVGGGEPADSRRIVVVGAGPAGLEAARVLALRGHQVSLHEQSGQLGGTARVAALPYAPNGDLVDWLAYSVRQLPVALHLGAAVSAEQIARMKPDHVILAVGAQRQGPEIAGKNQDHVFDGEELHGILLGHHPRAIAKLPWLSRWLIAAGQISGLLNSMKWLRLLSKIWMPLGRRVTILGGGLIGLELAEYLSDRGRQVSVLEPSFSFGVELSLVRRARVLALLRKAGVQLLNQAKVSHIDERQVHFSINEEVKALEADTVIIAMGATPNRALAEALADQPFQVHAIGDCDDIGYIEGAILSARKIAVRL